MATLFELQDWLKSGGEVICGCDTKNPLHLAKDNVRLLTENGSEYLIINVFADYWEKYKDEPQRWIPKDGDEFYHITSAGEIYQRTWDDNNYCDKNMFRNHNCFKTKDDTRKARDRWIAEQELLSYCDGEKQPFITISYMDGKFFALHDGRTVEHGLTTSPYRFASEESCKRAIHALGPGKLKLIFNIKE